MGRYFLLFLLVFEPQQGKFYTIVMKSNLLNVQMQHHASLSRFMALLELSDEITVQTQLLKEIVLTICV